MNTKQAIVSLLLPVFSAGLAAQDLALKAEANPTTLHASVDGAARGKLVILVVGLRQGPMPLPNGELLGITPDLLAGFAIADGVNPAPITVDFRFPMDPGITFYVQAVSINLALPLERQDMGLSPVRSVKVTKV